MKPASILRSCLLAGALWFYGPAGALAQTPTPTPTATPTPTPTAGEAAITGTCAVLDSTCVNSDSAFVPTSVKVSITKTVTTATCVGTTTALPTKATKCDGEILGGASGETAPLQPCTILLGATSAPIDDWTETITKTGKVTLTCKAGGTDTK
jgi:hypothetical protein